MGRIRLRLMLTCPGSSNKIQSPVLVTKYARTTDFARLRTTKIQLDFEGSLKIILRKSAKFEFWKEIWRWCHTDLHNSTSGRKFEYEAMFQVNSCLNGDYLYLSLEAKNLGRISEWIKHFVQNAWDRLIHTLLEKNDIASFKVQNWLKRTHWI